MGCDCGCFLLDQTDDHVADEIPRAWLKQPGDAKITRPARGGVSAQQAPRLRMSSVGRGATTNAAQHP